MSIVGARPPIFTFWEPRGAVLPYLQLCRETWRRGLFDSEVITLDYANVDDYVEPGTLDMPTLKRLSLPLQKDAVMIAVLLRHGGLFLDMDTLVVRDISPVIHTLDRTEMFCFGGNISVVGGRRGAPILQLWLENIQRRLALVANSDVSLADVTWNFLGNLPLDEARAALHQRTAHRRIVRSAAPGRWLWDRIAATKPPPGTRGSLLRRLPRRLEFELSQRSAARHWLFLDRKGFYPELAHARAPDDDRTKIYRDFWFSEDIPVEAALNSGTAILGLHNSMTPPAYANLSRGNVLAHPSLLSRTIRHLLATA
ncbi:MAG: hypothetical protein KIS68_01745 [Bauldia sp.]|nr:hypothetical protein [Bauldia sp.]